MFFMMEINEVMIETASLIENQWNNRFFFRLKKELMTLLYVCKCSKSSGRIWTYL